MTIVRSSLVSVWDVIVYLMLFLPILCLCFSNIFARIFGRIKISDGYVHLLDYDPCASHPCKNGATCMAKFIKGKTTYECYCPIGFGGMNCDSSKLYLGTRDPLVSLQMATLISGPCDNGPCKNNGTCRTTRTQPDFFCECQPGWGSRDCDIRKRTLKNLFKHLAIPNTVPPTYGRNVELISSGKVDWINELRMKELQKMREKTTKAPGET